MINDNNFVKIHKAAQKLSTILLSQLSHSPLPVILQDGEKSTGANFRKMIRRLRIFTFYAFIGIRDTDRSATQMSSQNYCRYDKIICSCGLVFYTLFALYSLL